MPLNQYNSKGEKHGWWEELESSFSEFLKIRKHYVNGEHDGLVEEYDHDGSIMYKGHQKELENGLVEEYGFWEFYHENGQLWCSGNYEAGKETGLWNFYDDSGNKKQIIFYLKTK